MSDSLWCQFFKIEKDICLFSLGHPNPNKVDVCPSCGGSGDELNCKSKIRDKEIYKIVCSHTCKCGECKKIGKECGTVFWVNADGDKLENEDVYKTGINRAEFLKKQGWLFAETGL